MTKTFHLGTLAELKVVASELKALLGDRTLLLFVGEVGAGKTTLVSTLCQILGMSESASPSFSIHHRYENSKNQALDHVDLYRVEDEADIESTGFWDLFMQENGWVVVEWPDRIQDSAWPLYWNVFKVEILKLEGEKREIKISSLRVC